MAQHITPKLNNAEQILVVEALNYDKNGNYSALEYYLKEILAGHNVVFKTRSDTDFTVPPTEAWRVISAWGADANTNLPVGERGGMRLHAARLLSYIQVNLVGKSTEAAASYRLILEQADRPIIKVGETTTDPGGLVLQKAYDLRREQIKQLQNGLIGKLTTNLETTRFMQNLPDAQSRALVLQMVAANNISFRSLSNFSPEKINQLLLHQAGYKQLNSAMHLAYSRASQADFAELATTINNTISKQYGNTIAGEDEYRKDMSALNDLSNLAPALSDINWMVDHIAFASSPAEKTQLIAALRSQIVTASRGQHQEGLDVLKAALSRAGLPETSLSSLESLVPYLEEIQVKQRHLLLGSELQDRDPRLMATSSLAATLGVDLTIPWLNQADLLQYTKEVTSKYSVQTLAEAAGKTNDLKELGLIKTLMNRTSDYEYYRGSISNSLILAGQEALAKSRGNLAAAATPITRFTSKMWAGYEKIDHIIGAPARGWVEIQEKYPLLDPFGFVISKWTGVQIGLASRINVWAAGISGSGSWFAGFAGHIADYTEGFVKREGSWSGAGFFFFERKWGNILDWTAKKAFKQESWAVLKGSVGNSIWAAASKIAPGLTAKIATYAAEAGLSASGVGLILLGVKVGWDALKFGLGKIRDFITNAGGFRDWVINRIPLMVGGLGTGLMALPALLLSGIGALGTGLLAFLSTLLGSLVPLFALAATWALALAASFVLIFYIFKPTTELDSGITQLVTNILCNDDQGAGTEASAPPAQAAKSNVASCANCLVKYLTACYGGGKLTGDLVTSKFGCLLATAVAPGAAEAIKASAVGYNWLQCVGFARAAAICGGGDLPGQAVASGYIRNDTPGYKFVSGAQWCVPGDFGIVDGAIGHIFVVGDNNNGTLKGIDANFVGDGVVSNNTPFPSSMVAGCLKKI